MIVAAGTVGLKYKIRKVFIDGLINNEKEEVPGRS